VRHFFILFILGLFLVGCKDDDKTQPKYVELEKCTGNITAELGSYKLSIPRYGVSITAGGQTGSYDKNYHHRPCSQKIVDNAEKIFINGKRLSKDLELGIIRIWYNPDYSKAFYHTPEEQSIVAQHNQTLMDEAQSNINGKVLLKNGVIKHEKSENVFYYIIPANISQTKFNKPIIFKCRETFITTCRTSYILPNGISLRYDTKNHENDFINLEKSVRDYVESLIVDETTSGEER
jgi:hypothetical protein